MTLQQRDKRALTMLAASAFLSLVIYLWPAGSGAPVAAAAGSIPIAEQRIVKLREIIATLPGKQKLLDGLSAQLRERESGTIAAQTAAQAQAQLIQILRKLGRSQAPPIEIGQFDMGPVQGLGKDYGEVVASASFNCRIEQLVNLLADLSAQKDLIATHELQVRAGDQKQKVVGVRLTVSGVIPRNLVPERKTMGAF
jgi:hypothetical protein